MKSNVIKVISNDRCCGCGVCAGICPEKALRMEINKCGFYRPVRTKNKCTGCSLCLRVCPVNTKEKEIMSRDRNDKIFGKYINIWGGWAKDKRLRGKSSSGGVARKLAFDLLTMKDVDGVWAVTSNNCNLLEPQVKLFEGVDCLKNMAKSLYIPTEYSRAVRYLSNNFGCYLIIGLPCQIAGLRKAESHLKAKMILVELFCGRIVSRLLTETYIKLFTKEKMENLSIDYRDKVSGWYKFSISVRNKRSKKIIAMDRFNNSIFGFLMNRRYFAQNSCFDCSYNRSGVGDITLGDFWKSKYSDEKQGVSLIVTRTTLGERVMRKCEDVFLFQTDISDLYSAQSYLVRNYKFSRSRLLTILKKEKQIFNKTIIKICVLLKNLKFIYHICKFDDRLFSLTVKYFHLTKNFLKYHKALTWNIALLALEKLVSMCERHKYNRPISDEKIKIFVTGIPDIGNQGSFAMFKVLIDSVNEMWGSKCTYVMDTNNTEAAQKVLIDLDIKNVEVIPDYFSILFSSRIGLLLKYYIKLLKFNLELKRNKKHSAIVKKLSECNLIVNIGGDTLSHSSGQFSTIMQLGKLLLGKKIGLKTVILAHTLGKYKEPYKNHILAKMNRIDLITVREIDSFDYMISLGFKKIVKTSDLAFLLKSTNYIAGKINISKIGKFACFVPSSLFAQKSFSDLDNLNKRYKIYLEMVNYMIDTLLQRNFNVVLTPHVFVKSYRDDLDAKEIKERLYPNNNKVIYLDKQFYANEIKEIIRYSKCIVSFRMHPTISAVSQKIPSFLVTDSHKGKLLRDLMPERFIIIYYKLSQPDLRARVEKYLPEFLDSLGELELKLSNSKIREIQKAAMKNFVLLDKLMQKDRTLNHEVQKNCNF